MSRNKQTPPLLPERFTAALKLRLNQIIGILIITGAIAYTLTLISHSPQDNAFTYSSTSPTQNWLGIPGAYISDISLYLFGIGAYGLSLIGIIWGGLYFKTQQFRSPTTRLLWLPIMLMSLSMALAAILTPTHVFPTDFPTVAGIGGIIGTVAELNWTSNLATWLGHNLQDWLPDSIIIPTINILTSLYLRLAIAAVITIAAVILMAYESGLRVAECLQFIIFIGKYSLISARFIAALFLFPPLWLYRRLSGKPASPSVTATPAPSSAAKPSVGVKKTAEILPQKKRPAKQYNLLKDDAKNASPTALPSLELLGQAGEVAPPETQEALQQNARMLETVLQDFGVKGEITQVSPGPVVTLYELQPAPGTKTSRVVALSDDIARSMSALSVRIATIPGRNVIGIELPNRQRSGVILRELLESDQFQASAAGLPLVLGKDIGGAAEIADLSMMPHLLIAGTTGSGKSVGLNAMILSLLYRYTADECRFIMVDPKMLELSVYDNIPHLLTPVVTDPKKALVALRWAVKQMEERYRAMSYLSVRNIDGYNKRVREALAAGEVLGRKVQVGFDEAEGQPLYEEQSLPLEIFPYIVVVVDEMADLMLVAGKEIEAAIQRLAQMARAAGIHLIMATQRPSVDVITGTIKANFPTRISFMVTSKIDSRTILGEQGAEQLLGRGDMLFMEGGGRIKRVHGPFVADGEVEAVCNFLRSLGTPQFIEDVTREEEEDEFSDGGEDSDAADALYQQAVELVMREGKASTSFIQRHLQIGYNRAARIMDMMEKNGIVSAANHVGKREIL